MARANGTYSNSKRNYIINTAKRCEMLTEFLDKIKYNIGRIFFCGKCQTPYDCLADLNYVDVDYEICEVLDNNINRNVELKLDGGISIYIKY